MDNDRTHTEIWIKVGELEKDISVMAERLEITSQIVQANQEEFRGKIRSVEENLFATRESLTAFRSEFKAGTGLLAFLIVTGIAALGVYLQSASIV